MKIAVCGGGISGLTAAYYVSKLLSRSSSKSFKIILIEKSKNVGGWMKTNVKNVDRKDYDGAINEEGPRSIRTAGIVGNNTLQLVSDLGFEDEIIPVKATDLAAKKRLIFVNKTLHELPSSLMSACKKQTPFSKSLAQFIVPGLFKEIPSEYETMHEIFSARFGNEVADYLVSSFTRGVFAADSRHLSMKAAFPAAWKRLKPKKASMPRKPDLHNADLFNKTLLANSFIKRGKRERWTQWAVSSGFSSFTESLAKHLTENMNVEILRDSEIEQIKLNKNGKVSIELESKGSSFPGVNEIENVDHVISALPSHALSRILRRNNVKTNDKNHKLNVLGLMLSYIRWVDVAVTNVELSGSPESLLPSQGFGHLVPTMEPSKVLGIVYDSCAFPQHDRCGEPTTRLTCMSGGSWFRQLFGDPDVVSATTIEQAALESLAEQLGITRDPMNMNITVCKKCIPMYGVGHTDLVEDAEDHIKEHKLPISLAGSSFWGVSINDCIYNSRIIVYTMLRDRGII